MTQISYETIRPLIASAQQEGRHMRVTFRCPVSGTTTEASAHIPDDDSIAGMAKQSAKRSLMWSLKRAVAGAVRSALGYGIAGRAASDAAYGAMSGMGSQPSYTEEQKQAAVVQAFASVQSRFVWDAGKNSYIAAEAAGDVLTDFATLLGSAPVTTPYDQKVLARMLTEIACADGNLGEEERQFLAGFLRPEMGSVDELARQPRLSPAELAETRQGPSREAMLMLAWGVALTDEELAPEEQARLGEQAAALQIPPHRADELRRYAQHYMVDQALAAAYPGGQRDPEAHAQAMDLARRLGVDPADAERVDIRYRKRMGLA